MFRNIFFDRDGIINEVVIRSETVSSPRTVDEFSIRPEFVELINGLCHLNLQKFVVSNQPDISRNLLRQDDLDRMTARLEDFGFIDIRYCVHDDKHDCHCRKPKPGMLLDLLDKYQLKPAESLFVGDSVKDVMAGQAAGVSTVLLRTPYNREAVCSPEFMVDSLGEILSIIRCESSALSFNEEST